MPAEACSRNGNDCFVCRVSMLHWVIVLSVKGVNMAPSFSDYPGVEQVDDVYFGGF